MKAALTIPHQQSADWQRELEFYIQELIILNGRLAKFASKDSAAGMTGRAEHFKNKFIKLRERIDVLSSDIGMLEDNIEHEAKEQPQHIDEVRNVANNKIFDRMVALSNSIALSRYEFNQFMANAILTEAGDELRWQVSH